MSPASWQGPPLRIAPSQSSICARNEANQDTFSSWPSQSPSNRYSRGTPLRGSRTSRPSGSIRHPEPFPGPQLDRAPFATEAERVAQVPGPAQLDLPFDLARLVCEPEAGPAVRLDPAPGVVPVFEGLGRPGEQEQQPVDRVRPEVDQGAPPDRSRTSCCPGSPSASCKPPPPRRRTRALYRASRCRAGPAPAGWRA